MKLLEKLKYTPDGWETTPFERKSYYLYFAGQNAIYFLLANYLTTYLMLAGIDPLKSSLVMVVVKVWDAINDAIFGAIFDSVKFKSGKKYLPWLKISTVLIPITTVLLFCIPANASENIKLAWFAVAYILWDSAYTLCDVPIYGSITAMTRNLTERSSMLSYKSIWAGVGIAFITLAGTVLVSEHIGASYSVVATATAVFAIITMLPVLKTLKERHVPDAEESFTLRKMFNYLFKNKYLLIYYFGYFFYSAANISGSLKLFVSYYMFNDTLFSLVVDACGTVPSLIASLLVPAMLRKIDKMKLYRICCVLMVALSLVMWVIGYNNLILHIVLYVIRSIPLSIIGVIMFIFTPDCAEYGKFKTGIDAKGITFSIQTFMVKLTAAVSGAMGMFILGLKSTGWKTVEVGSFKELQELGVQQSEHALDVLWFSYVMIPAIGCLLAYIIWKFYRLNDKDVQIMTDCNTGKITREEAEGALSRKY
ncbi:MAG: MFS transporter [Clostridia bacterium]|nr:MFS transporter [Clostridia bacterium]MBQ7121729.1 MFS transporter [Clostridia bacterium]